MLLKAGTSKRRTGNGKRETGNREPVVSGNLHTNSKQPRIRVYFKVMVGLGLGLGLGLHV